MSTEPCTRSKKLSLRQRHEARARGMCMNGCEKPIAPPSQVVCQDCLDAMGEELRMMLARLERRLSPEE